MVMNKRVVGMMSTYPARRHVLDQAISSLEKQVDILYICTNDYDVSHYQQGKTVFFRPPADKKDVGKFIFEVCDDDICFLLDDDIIYPEDYVSVMSRKLYSYTDLNAVVGVHGVTYVDLFEGKSSNRSVQVFNQRLDADIFVNQLGTGTVCCWGCHMPGLGFMEGSEKFVDVRFAWFQEQHHRPRIAISRPKDWLKEIEKSGSSIFTTFTQAWPSNVLKEVQHIAGYSRLPSLRSAECSIKRGQIGSVQFE